MSKVQNRAERKGRNIFQEVVDAAQRKGIMADKSQESIEWARNFIRKNVYNVKALNNAPGKRLKSYPQLGKMYMFKYEAITPNLPYWDAFPLTLFFGEDQKTIYGFNLHYAPIKYRIIILNKLYQLLGNNNLTERARMVQTYSFLKRMAEFRYLAPCIKRYRVDQVRSKFLEVPSTEWHIAIFLPVAKWQKASQQQVHSDYRKKI